MASARSLFILVFVQDVLQIWISLNVKMRPSGCAVYIFGNNCVLSCIRIPNFRLLIPSTLFKYFKLEASNYILFGLAVD